MSRSKVSLLIATWLLLQPLAWPLVHHHAHACSDTRLPHACDAASHQDSTSLPLPDEGGPEWQSECRLCQVSMWRDEATEAADSAIAGPAVAPMTEVRSASRAPGALPVATARGPPASR